MINGYEELKLINNMQTELINMLKLRIFHYMYMQPVWISHEEINTKNM